MPADITLNSGSGGAIIATDPTTSSEHYQLIKLAQGAVGTFTLVTSANAFPVVIGSSFQGGIVSLSSQVSVTSTAATNPWSSAPGFNVPVVSVSSGLVQVSGTPLVNVVGTSSGVAVVTTSGGLTVSLSSAPPFQSTVATNPWSSAPGFNVPVVSVSSGLIQLSSQITVTATGPVTVTSGTVTLSSVHTVTATAGTNPWSSAPGFNVPVVSVSSGLGQVIPIGVVSSLGYLSTYFQSTGGAASVSVRSSASSLMGYSLFNSTAAIRSVKIYNTTSAPAVGSTTNVLLILMAPGSTGGGGANLMLPPPGLFASNGIGFTMTANVAGTDTGAPGSNDLTLNLYIV